MDLYGDLPPAQGSEKSTITAQYTRYGTTNPVVAEKVKNTNAAKVTPKLSSSLAFKPRQAIPGTLIVKSIVAAIPTKSAELEIDKIPPEIHSPTKPSNTFKNDTTTNTSDEFNENSSYDVTDAYDPKRPNDYIAYCEERLERRKHLRLQDENNRHMQAAEEARTMLEQERREAAQRGDYQSLLNSAGVHSFETSQTQTLSDLTAGPVSMGRGRGRGVANLPAWMTQQIAATTAAVSTAEQSLCQFADATSVSHISDSAPVAVVGVKRKQQGMFSKPSCVLLLKNMVAAAEASDEEERRILASEVSQECAKYGPVCGASVFTVHDSSSEQLCPAEERVRTFVHFERQDSSIRAFRDMNGRFFGGRQIAASFFPEDRYQLLELASDSIEQAAWFKQ